MRPWVHAVRVGILLQTAEIFLILLPGNVADVRLLDQHAPFLLRQCFLSRGAVGTALVAVASKGVCPGIAGIVKGGHGDASSHVYPHQLPLFGRHSQAAWEAYALFAEVSSRGIRGTQALEGIEEHAECILYLP